MDAESSRPPDDEGLARLEALAAGELAPEEATRLRRHLRTHPLWAKAFDEAVAVERRLRDIRLEPLPPGFVERVAAGLPPRAARRRLVPAALVRLAASVLLALGAWIASGALPPPADPSPPAGLAASLLEEGPALPDVASGAWLTEPARPVTAWAGGATAPAAAGAVFLLLGFLLARRLHARPSSKEFV